MDIALPVFLLVLDPDENPPSATHTAAVARLMSLATENGAAFKEAMAGLESAQRTVLEQSMRQALSHGHSSALSSSAAAPSISLKSFG